MTEEPIDLQIRRKLHGALRRKTGVHLIELYAELDEHTHKDTVHELIMFCAELLRTYPDAPRWERRIKELERRNKLAIEVLRGQAHEVGDQGEIG